MMLLDTSLVPPAACWMLRAISRVAAPCCSTAAAMAVVTSLISPMVWPMLRMAPTAEVATCCMLTICRRISSVGFARARGFNRRVERQQIGLGGDGLNEIDHDRDAAGVIGEPLHGGVGLAGLGDGLAGDLRRTDNLAAGFGNRRRQFLGA